MPTDSGDLSSVSEGLEHYKANGCSVLVAGDVPDPVIDQQVVRLLGHESGSRRRVLGAFNRDVHVARERLREAAPGAEPATIVASTEQPRSVATDAAGMASAGIDPGVRWVATDVASFESGLVAAIQDAVAPDAVPDPGVLRVSVDSLCPLLRARGVERSKQFVSTVSDAVRERNGMAHFVTQGEPAADLESTLVDEFDVIIDNRVTRSGTEERWRIPAFDVDTGWHVFVRTDPND